ARVGGGGGWRLPLYHIYSVLTRCGGLWGGPDHDRTGLHAGETVSLDIDASQAHWFDTAGRVIARAAA
ncbi:MAG: hypothetical protein K0M67_10020, partial [Thiobacillus sp.]|nr:hypothetical protein [Thiobacillus sp.]